MNIDYRMNYQGWPAGNQNLPYPYDPGYISPGLRTGSGNAFYQPPTQSPLQLEQEFDKKNIIFKQKNDTKNDDLQIMINAFKEQIFINRYIENLKEELARQRDFNLDIFYGFFDDDKSGKVTLKELREGFSRLEVMCSEKEAFSILRRYSRDKDERIDKGEFWKIFKPIRAVTFSNMLREQKADKTFKFRYETNVIIREILKKNIEAEVAWQAMKKKFSVRNSNLEHLFARLDGDGRNFLTELNVKDTLQKNGMFANSQEVKTILNKFNYEDKKQADIGQVNLVQFVKELTSTPSPKHSENLEQIIEDLKIQVDIEKEIVKTQDAICKNKNFRTAQIFVYFDKNSSCKITLKEFEKGLKKLGLKLDDKNLAILFQKINKTDDGNIEFEEFLDIFTLRNDTLRRLAIAKPFASNAVDNSILIFFYKFIILLKSIEKSTLELCQKLFQKHLESELQWMKIKEGYKSKKDILRNLFDFIDYNNDGVLTEVDFINFLKEAGYIANYAELKALIARFDSNGNGILEYEEFVDELTKDKKIKKVKKEDIEDDIVSYIQDFYKFLRELERCKILLRKKPDFRVSEVFKFFDTNSTGQVSPSEFMQGFKQFGVDLTDREAFIICMRFSRDPNYTLSINEFADFFNNIQDTKRNAGLQESKIGLHNYIEGFGLVLTEKTMMLVSQLFKLWKDAELFWDTFKKKITKNNKPEKIFKALDISGKKMLSEPELIKFFEENGIPYDYNVINYFMFFLDRNNSGKIDAKEFEKEFVLVGADFKF